MSSFKDPIKTWEGPQCQSLMVVPLIKDYVCHMNILSLIL